MKITVEISAGPDAGKVFTFEQPANLLIGRSKDALIQTGSNDRYVSRNHCILEISPPKCVMHHLSTTSETRVNDVVVQEIDINDNDIIRIGYTSLKIHIEKDIQTKEVICKKCGAEIKVLDCNSTIDLCDECNSVFQKKDDEQVVAKKYECEKCGKDLTHFANSDNKAKLLSDRVTYLCEDCLPHREYLKGDCIGNFELIKFLDHGGMGAVYIVYDPLTARMMVLKKIEGLNTNELVIKHFIREINVHKSLRHENIIQFIDSGIHSSIPFLVMEYANSGSLENLIEEMNGAIPVRDCCKFMIQSLKGLKYLHDNNFIHRDIKPGNILLQKKNGERIARLTDFGLAKPYKNASGTVLTKVGERKGSLLFMPPEQIANTKDVDFRADIYSMGITFYYLLTSGLPFHYPSCFELNSLKKKYGRNREKLLRELNKLGFNNNVLNIILSESFIPVEQKLPGIDPHLAAIINKSVCKEIDKRYQKVEDFLMDLEKLKDISKG
ncbi:MAG: protein kinase [Bacteroidales bacterium]|nr:protein kinase [Bacteroidales bacterium]